jgi:putative serine protease PepD
MFGGLRALVPLACLLTLILPSSAGALDLPKLAAAAKPSVVLVTLYDGRGQKVASGSGFFVSSDGRLVTNHHVVEGATRATVTLSDGRELAVRGLLADDPMHDIAIVAIEGSGYTPLPIGDTSTLRVGDDIVVVGSPLGLSTTVSSGIVAAVRENGLSDQTTGLSDDEKKKASAWGLQITAPVSHGSSGSPILDAAGQVVGVAVGVMGEGENLNFGVPTAYVKSALTRIPAGAAPKPFGEGRGDLWTNLEISAGLGLLAYLIYLVVTRLQRRSQARRDEPVRRRP